MLFEAKQIKWYYNKHFYIALMLFLTSFISLSWHFWFLAFNENLVDPFFPPYNDTNRLAWDFFSFWSMQSTIMVVFYSVFKMLYLSTFNLAFKWVNNFNLRNFINIALIVAMLSYYLTVWIDGVPSNNPQTKFYYLNYWIPTHIQHAILPFMLLGYSIADPKEGISLKRFIKRNYIFYWLYVMLYIVIVSTRGWVLYLIDRRTFVRPWPWYYPYFFFNVRSTFPKGGWAIFFGAFFFFMLVFFLLGCLLIWINNLSFKFLRKYHVIEVKE